LQCHDLGVDKARAELAGLLSPTLAQLDD